MLNLVVHPLQHGALGIARSLGRWGIAVHAVRPGPTPAALSRYSVEHPIGVDASDDAVLATLTDVAARLGDRPVLMPVSDRSATFVSRHDDALRECYRLPAQPIGLAEQLSDKRRMHETTAALGVPNPATSFPAGRDDVERFAATAVFPIVVKGIDGQRMLERGGVSMAIVQDRAELLAAYDRLESPTGPRNVMLQEYIPGGPESVWMFNGYFDAASECLFGITGRKLRQYPPYTGATVLGACRPNPEVDETTRRLMKALGYRGILDIGYRYDARDGRYKVLDINPRIGATFRLFVDDAGLDVARVLYLDLTGQPVRAGSPRWDRRWLVESHDVASSWRYARDGRLRAGDWVRSLRGVEETAWYAKDDRRPFTGMVRHIAGKVPERLRR